MKNRAQNRPRLTQAQCLVHTRRYFKSARNSDSAAVNALEQITSLYRNEFDIRNHNLTQEKILQYRRLRPKPLVTAFFEWCQAQ